MAEKIVSDEVALRCLLVCREVDELIEAVTSALTNLDWSKSSEVEQVVCTEFHFLLSMLSTWQRKQEIPTDVLEQAKEIVDSEF